MDQFQTAGRHQKEERREAIDCAITEAYQWLLVPVQPRSKGRSGLRPDLKLQGQGQPRHARQEAQERKSLVRRWAGSGPDRADRIRSETGNHVRIKQLARVHRPAYL